MGSIVSGELMCLSCRGIPKSTDCGVVEKCGSHSVCYIDMIVASAGSIYFNMGCRDTVQCGSHSRRELSHNTTDVPFGSFLESLHQIYVPENMSTPKLLETYGSNYSELDKYSDKRMVQRRDDKHVCSQCCSNGNLCNDEGCGQTGFMQTRGPICYACDQQLKPDSCRQITVCGRDDMCYIEEMHLGQYTLYHTTCRSKIKCHDNNIVIIAGRDVSKYAYVNNDVMNKVHSNMTEKRSLSTAKGCCQTNLCNTIIPQNGNWGPWTSWGSCTTTCGYNGSRVRTRKCEYPPPNYGGLPCVGNPTEADTTCANSRCNQGMMCLSCPSSVSPGTCNYVEACGPNSVCYLEQYINHAGGVRYQSGCRDKLQCVTGVRRSKRFMINGDYLSCEECCQGDLCNSHGCGEPRNSNRGPVCYSCAQQHDTHHCDQIDVCGVGQRCGLIRHKFVDTFYQTMCLDKAKCVSDDSNSDDYPKCCTTTLCTFASQTNKTGIVTPTKSNTLQSGFTTSLTTKATANQGFITSPTTKSTAPTTKSTAHQGFTTAPTTKSTAHQGFTTAPTTKSTAHQGFTTAPTTKSTAHQGFTTAPTTKSTAHQGFTTAPTTKSTAHQGFTTAPKDTSSKPTVGQWSEWGAWGACLEPHHSVTGIKKRFRYCNNPIHTPDPCPHGHSQEDRKYCTGGATDACIPASITKIEAKGTWASNQFVVLQCIVTGQPQPSVKWQTHTDHTDTTVHRHHNDSMILIGPIQQKHAGKYVCEASNTCGNAASMEYIAPNFTRRRRSDVPFNL